MIHVEYVCEKTNRDWIYEEWSNLPANSYGQHGMRTNKYQRIGSIGKVLQNIGIMNIGLSIKYLLAIIACIIFSIPAFADSDRLILRNGQEFDVKLLQLTDEKIIYANSINSMLLQQEVLSKDVYMVHIEKYGNLYFTADGKRTTGETERVDYKKKDVVYLVQGAEIAADNVYVSSNKILCFIKTKGAGLSGFIGKSSIEERAFDKSEVFMIRYRNGMRDIITKIEMSDHEIEKPDAKKDTASVANEKPEFVVVFHSVVKGETLEQIAKQYNVYVQQIIEWNDLPSTTKSKTQLAEGTQLMIYQSKI